VTLDRDTIRYVDEPYYSQVIKRMRGAAHGLTNAASRLDSVSENEDDENGGEN
jgi:hypothetical protein